jgi:uncharacterized membrane protein
MEAKVIKKILYLIAIFVFLFTSHCFAEKLQEEQISQGVPDIFSSTWQIQYQKKWVVQDIQNPELILDIPSTAVIRYCAGEIISLSSEYAGNRGVVTFEIVQDEDSETGVRYEIREIQILCD